MPAPAEYERASAQFYEFLEDARDMAGLETTHQAYTMVQGVLKTFRRRLTTKDAILFANALPPLVRALFITDWDIEEPQEQFQDRAVMTKEVQSLRPNHNFSPDSAIVSVATALRQNMNESSLNEVLKRLPARAQLFWRIDS